MHAETQASWEKEANFKAAFSASSSVVNDVCFDVCGSRAFGSRIFFL